MELAISKQFSFHSLYFNFRMSEKDTRGKTTQADRDNRSDQCNPNNPKYQGHVPSYSGKGDKADLDNRSNQKNPNNEVYQEPKGEK